MGVLTLVEQHLLLHLNCMSTILVIEDEPQVRANIRDILELASYTTLTAGDGVSGAQIAREKVPDLIICDVMMPLLDGYGVISELRRTPETADIPFVFLTAKSDREALRLGMDMGADDYLSKPFSPEELLNTVATRLAKHQTLVQRFTSQIEQANEAIKYLRHYDSSTGLPNHSLLEKHFQLAQIYASQQALSLAVLLVELDQLEQIGATLGHGIRKRLLAAFGQRLWDNPASQFNHSSYVVAYLGGRQFGILTHPLTSQSAVIDIASTLLDRLHAPFVLEGQEIFVKPSIGIALYPENGDSLDGLLGCAEGALVDGLKRGDRTYHFYTPQSHVRALERLTLESKLHHALTKHELDVFYQPQYELAQGRLVGAEALIRWHLPDRGFVPPMELISIAEETGLILPIGAWVLETACRQAHQWQLARGSGFKISVNLSARQFYHPDLAGQVQNILHQTQLTPANLILEITESSVLADTQKALTTLHALKSLGVRIAIDDFGTGYSSLSCLRQFPFDVLKIDQSFVRNIHNTPDNIPITRVIIQLAKELNLELVAEGVETRNEFMFLIDHACPIGQGYLLGRPVPAARFNFRDAPIDWQQAS